MLHLVYLFGTCWTQTRRWDDSEQMNESVLKQLHIIKHSSSKLSKLIFVLLLLCSYIASNTLIHYKTPVVVSAASRKTQSDWERATLTWDQSSRGAAEGKGQTWNAKLRCHTFTRYFTGDVKIHAREYRVCKIRCLKWLWTWIDLATRHRMLSWLWQEEKCIFKEIPVK